LSCGAETPGMLGQKKKEKKTTIAKTKNKIKAKFRRTPRRRVEGLIGNRRKKKKDRRKLTKKTTGRKRFGGKEKKEKGGKGSFVKEVRKEGIVERRRWKKT